MKFYFIAGPWKGVMMCSANDAHMGTICTVSDMAVAQVPLKWIAMSRCMRLEGPLCTMATCTFGMWSLFTTLKCFACILVQILLLIV